MQHEHEHLMDSLDYIALAQMFRELARKKIAAGSVEEGADAQQRARPETATRRVALMTFFSPSGCDDRPTLPATVTTHRLSDTVLKPSISITW
jgi:hypothetical protein